MAIEKYTTEGIILDAYDQGEHDRAFKIFTKEFGLVIAHARSVRKLESKLRAHLMPRSIALVTLVKGREVWRITGAEKREIASPFIKEVTDIAKRFIKGEGVHKTLYKRLVQLATLSSFYQEDKARLLMYYVILVELGYADAEALGVSSIKEYAALSIDDMYTHLLLRDKAVREHTLLVLKEVQL